MSEFLHQYKYAGNYVDRKEALAAAQGKNTDADAIAIRTLALQDPFFSLRQDAIEQFSTGTPTPDVIQKVRVIAQTDPNRPVRAAAIDLLAKAGEESDKAIYAKACTDSSYSVAGAGLEALSSVDSASAHTMAKKLMKEPAKGRLTSAIGTVLAAYGDPAAFDFLAGEYEKMPLTQSKFSLTFTLQELVEAEKDPVKFKRGVDLICDMRNSIPASQRAQTDPYINNNILKKIADKKKASGETALSDYVLSKITK